MNKKKSKITKIIFEIIGGVVTLLSGVILTIKVIPYAKSMRANPDLIGGEWLITPMLLLIYIFGLMIYKDIKSGIIKSMDDKYGIKVNKGDKI